MSIYDNVVKTIKGNQLKRSNTYFNCIPFVGFERLEQEIPGIEKSTYYIVTAGSGIGKSKFVRSLFVHHPVNYVIENPEADIKLKIFIFSLEESKQKVMLGEISKYLFSRFGIRKSIKQLLFVGRHNEVESHVVDKVEQARNKFEQFEKYVEIHDNVRKPSEMYSTVEAWLRENGHIEYKDIHVFEDGQIRKKTVVDKYIPNHPNTYCIVLTDHVKLMQGDRRGDTIKRTMDDWSSNYCLKLRDDFGCSVVNVQQQAAQQESIDNIKAKKTEPSLSGLGEHKLTQQDADIVLGLYAPDRYELQQHRGYDISLLRDNYRSMLILKNRNGSANKSLAMYFDGAVDTFKELPRPEDMEDIYDHITSGGHISELYNPTNQ